MSQFRFILEPYVSPKSKYRCPACLKKKTFTRYIDTEENQYLSEKVGRCDRLQKCGYHYPPKDFFQDNKLNSSLAPTHLPKPELDLTKLNTLSSAPPSYIDKDFLLGKPL